MVVQYVNDIHVIAFFYVLSLPEESISELLPSIELVNTSTFRMKEWQCYDAPFCYLNFSEVEMVSPQEAWALGQTAILHSDGSPPSFQGLYLPAIAK